MKAVVAGVIALFVVGGGWLGWTKHQASQETSAAVQVIQMAATQTERQLKARQEDGITFAEYFKRVSASVEGLDKSISDLESREWAHKPQDRDIAIAFAEQCKVIIRADQAGTRLIMEESNARDSSDAAKRELDEAESSIAIEWALKRYKRASDELIDVLKKQIDNAEEGKGKIERMLAADDAVKAAFGKDKGLSQATTDSMRKSITPAKDEKPAEG